jgi:hypothetical protein
MNPFDIRKTVITTETIRHDGGAPPVSRCVSLSLRR